MALSVGTPHGIASRVYPAICLLASAPTGYAASRPLVFGLSSPPKLFGGAILRLSKIAANIREECADASWIAISSLEKSVGRGKIHVAAVVEDPPAVAAGN